MDWLSPIFESIGILLVVAGLIFMASAIVANIGNWVALNKLQRTVAGILGGILLVIGVGLESEIVPLSSSADLDWISKTGDTKFFQPITNACTTNRKANSYTTQYRGTVYDGYLWHLSSSGCNVDNDGWLVIQGEFVERSLPTNQFCIGKMTINFRKDEGKYISAKAVWEEIRAFEKHPCQEKDIELPIELDLTPKEVKR